MFLAPVGVVLMITNGSTPGRRLPEGLVRPLASRTPLTCADGGLYRSLVKGHAGQGGVTMHSLHRFDWVPIGPLMSFLSAALTGAGRLPGAAADTSVTLTDLREWSASGGLPAPVGGFDRPSSTD